jgi:hypothetical protein
MRIGGKLPLCFCNLPPPTVAGKKGSKVVLVILLLFLLDLGVDETDSLKDLREDDSLMRFFALASFFDF